MFSPLLDGSNVEFATVGITNIEDGGSRGCNHDAVDVVICHRTPCCFLPLLNYRRVEQIYGTTYQSYVTVT